MLPGIRIEGGRPLLETLGHVDELEQVSAPQGELRGVAQDGATLRHALGSRRHQENSSRIWVRAVLGMDAATKYPRAILAPRQCELSQDRRRAMIGVVVVQ